MSISHQYCLQLYLEINQIQTMPPRQYKKSVLKHNNKIWDIPMINFKALMYFDSEKGKASVVIWGVFFAIFEIALLIFSIVSHFIPIIGIVLSEIRITLLNTNYTLFGLLPFLILIYCYKVVYVLLKGL